MHTYLFWNAIADYPLSQSHSTNFPLATVDRARSELGIGYPEAQQDFPLNPPLLQTPYPDPTSPTSPNLDTKGLCHASLSSIMYHIGEGKSLNQAAANASDSGDKVCFIVPFLFV